MLDYYDRVGTRIQDLRDASCVERYKPGCIKWGYNRFYRAFGVRKINIDTNNDGFDSSGSRRSSL